MDRVPEPELMLYEEQARAYASADFAEPHSRFVALLKERLPQLPSAGRALDLGCGPGDISRRFARSFSDWTVDAVDGSPAMIELGRRMTVEAGLAIEEAPELHELLEPDPLLHSLHTEAHLHDLSSVANIPGQAVEPLRGSPEGLLMIL